MFFGGIALTHLYFLVIAWRAQRSIHALSPEEARIASELGGRNGALAAAAMAMFNIPRTIRYSSLPVWTGFLQMFAGVANFINYWIVTMAFFAVCALLVLLPVLGPPVVAVVDAFVTQGINEQVARLGFHISVALFLLLLLFVAAPTITYVLGHLTLNVARRTMQKSLQDIQNEDKRPPILFLRSFLDDRVTLKPRPFRFEQWLLDGTSRSMTLDYLILSEGTQYGPTVALGNPDDPAPPYGVFRGYFDHGSWRRAVADLSRQSSAIIVALDTTEGIDWEIDHIVSQQLVSKTLFLLAPDDVGSQRGSLLLGRVLRACTQQCNVDFPTGVQPVLGFWTNARDDIELLTIDTQDVYAYLIAIRLFLRTKLGFETSPTRPPVDGRSAR